MRIKNLLISLTIIAFLAGVYWIVSGKNNKDTNSDSQVITIGYQTQCSQTWGALIMKDQKLYEKYLNQEYPDTDFEIVWQDSPSGPPITNNMIAGKAQFGFMGDMPLLVNGSQGQNHPNYKSVLIAMDGKGVNGKNQAIMINKDDIGIKIEDLAGKEVSTIFGSSAHRMLLEVLKKYNLVDKVTITNHDVSTGLASIETKKVFAHSTWEPYPDHMIERGKSVVLVEGTESKIDYLDGIVVNKDWAESHKKETVAFIKALIEAHNFILNNPELAGKTFSSESGFSESVSVEEAKNIYWDTLIYYTDISTLKDDVTFLQGLDKIKQIDVDAFIDTQYLKSAMDELEMTYPSEEELQKGWHEKVR